MMKKLKVPFEIKRKTLRTRHALVKLLAPKLYAGWQLIDRLAVETPRPMIRYLKETCRGNLVGAEIGVASGDNALSILEELPITRLFLVDPYTPYFECGDRKNFGHEVQQEAKCKLARFSEKIRFIKKLSVDAVENIGFDCDFVYIDANHEYCNVKNDIEVYYPIVKVGGVIGGHDYSTVFPGVVQAVNEFAVSHRFTEGVNFFHVFPDWWIIKEN